MFKFLGVIPARIGSTRLPRKPLADLCGKTLIQRTYEACQKSHLIKEFVVATDSHEIEEHVKSFGGNVYMTSPDHQSGTSRLLEMTEHFPNYYGYINIQGDHPILDTEHLDSLVIKLMELDTKSAENIATPIVRLNEWQEVYNPSTVKVITDKENRALYFSRSPIPFIRNKQDQDWLLQHVYWKHLGLYGFNYFAIQKLKELETSYLEKCESLEQLSWIYHGLKIHCVEVKKDVLAIDTPEDLEKVNEMLKTQPKGQI